MKCRIIPTVLAAALCLSLGLLVSARAQTASPAATTSVQDPPQSPPRRGGFERDALGDALNLTDAQKAQLKTIRQSEREKIDALRNDSTLSRDDKRAKIRAINESTHQQFLAILTPEQQQALQNMPKGPLGGGRGGFGPGGPGGPGLERLGLSADQQSKLRAIHESTRSRIDTARNDSTLTQDQREAKIKTIFDESRQQALAVLTPEQQQKLGQHRGHRGFGPRSGKPDGPPPKPPGID